MILVLGPAGVVNPCQASGLASSITRSCGEPSPHASPPPAWGTKQGPACQGWHWEGYLSALFWSQGRGLSDPGVAEQRTTWSYPYPQTIVPRGGTGATPRPPALKSCFSVFAFSPPSLPPALLSSSLLPLTFFLSPSLFSPFYSSPLFLICCLFSFLFAFVSLSHIFLI